MTDLTGLTLRHPLLASLLIALASAWFASGIPSLRTEFGSRVLVGDDHPAIRALDSLTRRYGGGAPLYVAWECGRARACESALDEPSLQLAHDLSVRLASAPHVRKVSSPSNSPLFVRAPDGFAIRRLVERGAIAPDRERLALLALEDPSWRGNLISADGRVASLIIQPSISNSETDEAIVESVLQAVAPHDGFEFAFVGEAFGNVIGGRELAESTGALVPLMVLVIALVVLFQTRSWQYVLASLATLGVALVWTFGLLGHLGWPRDSILEILAPLVLIVGVCDTVHFLSAYQTRLGREHDGEPRTSLLRASSEVWGPCLLTTATTGAALASFAASDLDTFERFGVASAFGVAACFVLTFVLLPLLLIAIPGAGAVRPGLVAQRRRLSAYLARVSLQNSGTVVATALVVLGMCAGSAFAWLQVDTSREELFGEGSRILEWVHFFEENLRPSYGIEIDLALGENGRVEMPEVLSRVSEFSDRVALEPHVGEVWSITRLIDRAREVIHGDAARGATITSAGNAELLEVLALEDPDLLAAWTGFDRRRLRISIDVRELNYRQASSLIERVEAHAEDVFPDSWKRSLTGTVMLGHHWVTDIQRTQVWSFLIAASIVFGLVAIFLRSFVLGLAAMLPGLAAVLIVLGVMAFQGLSLDVGRAMIAAVVIGIAVDDSIHLLYRYRRYRAAGRDVLRAVDDSLRATAMPIVTTSVALGLGFLTLIASAWGTVSSFGLFVSLAILMALLATVLLLPATFALVAPGRVRRRS